LAGEGLDRVDHERDGVPWAPRLAAGNVSAVCAASGEIATVVVVDACSASAVSGSPVGVGQERIVAAGGKVLGGPHITQIEVEPDAHGDRPDEHAVPGARRPRSASRPARVRRNTSVRAGSTAPNRRGA
jgi:hypothetical protein